MSPLSHYNTASISPLIDSRRAFLTSTAGGVGLAALASLLNEDLARGAPAGASPMAAQAPHYTPRATNCIFIYLFGGASQCDMFDPKPRLNELQGQPLPESLTKNVRFAFVKKETARIMGTPRTFRRYGQCGMDMSDLLPRLSTTVDDLALIRSMHTEAFNHSPGETMINTGTQLAGHPSVGAWVTYGLGNQSSELPGYVVMLSGTRFKPYTWSNGFLPSTYQGVRFRNEGAPVLNLETPSAISAAMHRSQLDAVQDLNRRRYGHVGDPEIATRIAAYETAFRMQTAAPELIDLSRETPHTLRQYGVGRPEEGDDRFARQCLLARRMVEQGVRFVQLTNSQWDHHQDLYQDHPKMCYQVDQPIAALIHDLKSRGLLDSTLVVITTEFGRTAVSDNGQKPEMPNGRDHHPFAFCTLLAGGGVRGGTILGSTDDLGWNITEDPVHVNDFHATILRLFGLDHMRLTYRFQGRDFRLTDVGGNVVHKLLA